MSEEMAADSGFDMDAGVSELGDSLFGSEPDIQPDNPEPEIAETPEESKLLEEETPDIEPDKEQTREAPQSWKKEMRDHWSALTPEVQDYIEQRENQMKEGLEKDRGDANLGRMMRDVMAPYSQILQQSQVDEPTMVRNLMNAHYRLSTASPEERQQLFSQLAQNYGVKLDGQETEIDPLVQQLQNELYQIKSSLNARDQATLQEQRQRVEEEVGAFASEHPLFDEVSEDLIPFVNAGLSLEEAYEKAIWANPVTREKEVERLAKEREDASREKAKQAAEKAKKAKSANVRGRDTVKAPTGPLGSMEDTLRNTYHEIQQRS